MRRVSIVQNKRCHNIKCDLGGLFVPRRYDQRHCDSVCKERCPACRQKYNQSRNEKLRQQRRERGRVA